MTGGQFKSGWIVLSSYYEAYKYARDGTISAYNSCRDRYYMIFINLNLATVKLYEAKVTLHNQYLGPNISIPLFLWVRGLLVILDIVDFFCNLHYGCSRSY